MLPYRRSVVRLALVASLILSWCLTSAGTTSAAVSFSAPVSYQTGTRPNAIAVGDFNGDAKLDLAVVNRDSGTVSILLGDGIGAFNATTPIDFGLNTANTDPRDVAVGDFNGDGKQDLAVVLSATGQVSIQLGNGLGEFTSPFAPINVGSTDPIAVAVGDFNGDGKQDLAVVLSTNGQVSIQLGVGDGSFTAATPVSVGFTGPIAVAVGDFNGDTKQDLAVVLSTTGAVSILLGDGLGGFTSPFAPINVGSTVPIAVAVGDFNGDTKPDLAVVLSTAGQVSIQLGVGDGSFTAATPVSVGFTGPIAVVVGDFDGDGKQDLAVVLGTSGQVSIQLGVGDGSFTAGPTIDFGPNTANTLPVAVAVGDFNGDGKQDLAVVSQGTSPGTVFVLLNTTSAGGGGGGGGGGASDSNNCFIATAAYGSPLAPQVQLLRDFRESYLSPSPIGRTLVRFYYQVSPGVAQVIARSRAARTVVRAGLTPVIWWAGLMLGSPTAGLAVLILASGLAVWLGLAMATRVRRRLRQPSRG